MKALVAKREFRLRACLIFCLAAAISAASAAQAQEPLGGVGTFHGDNVDLSVAAGFRRLEVSYFNGAWVPFRVTVSNQGPPVSGRLVVRCQTNDGPSPQFREFVKDIQLPTGSNQLHEISAYVNSSAEPQVKLIVGGQAIAEASVKVDRTYGSDNQVDVIVVDSDQTALGNIAQTSIDRTPNRPPFGKRPPEAEIVQPQATPQRQRGQRGTLFGNASQNLTARPSVIPPEELPRDFVSYDQVDALVLGDAPLSQLSEEQAKALRLWVASGGELIITGSADFSGLTSVGLGGLLPVQIGGSVTMSSPLADLTGVYGAFESADPLVVMTARLANEGRVLIGNAENPIVAERNYGSGLVRFVAMNPEINPYRGWIGAKELWADLLLPAAETKPRHSNWITFGRRATSNASRWGVQGFLFKLAQIAPPSPAYILLFLLFYVLCVGPINYALLRWKRRTDLAWVTIPAVVAVFTIVSVVVAQQSRGGSSVLASAALVELHQEEGIARVTGGLLLVPASKGTHEVTFEGPNTFANDVFQGSQSSSASAMGSLEGEHTRERFRLRIPMTTWASALFQVRSISDNAQPLVAIEPGLDSVSANELMITNLSETAVSKAVCINASGVSEPFDLDARARRPVRLTAPQPGSFNSWYFSKLGQSGDDAELFQEIAGLLDRETGGEPVFARGFFDRQSLVEVCKQLKRPILVGFIDRDPTALGFNAAFKQRSKVFYVIHL